MTDARPLISVCICTYRRPTLLEGLLDTIYNQLSFPGPVEIVVVDNDEFGSADPVLNKFVGRNPRLRRFRVPVQNISLSRNKAVAEARGRWIAMIDDDEQPTRTWLDRLYICAIENDADAVFGPVIPKFPKSAPEWIVAGKFFERPRHRTGTRAVPDDTRSGNVLIRADVITSIPGPFDPEFGLTGGEDSKLFDSLLAEGLRFFWCDDAEVLEILPEDRLTLRWLLERRFLTGQTYARILFDRDASKRKNRVSKFYFFSRSIVLLFSAVFLAIITAPTGKINFSKWLLVSATQTGKISSLFQAKYSGYQDESRIPR
jgi:succinoglycan biosynthesis protein ExoM